MVKSQAQPEKLRALFRSGKRFDYHKNETILRARETPRGVYIIEEGIVKMYSLSKEGNEHVLDFFGPGDILPIIWPFRHTVRSMYYEAITKAALTMIPRETFREVIAKSPDVMSAVFGSLVDRHHRYIVRIDNLIYSDALERSAYLILSLADRFGVKSAKGITIDAQITHENLGRALSMTRETFGRTLSRLQRRGMIGHDAQRHIVITDLTGLSRIIGREESEAIWPDLMEYAI